MTKTEETIYLARKFRFVREVGGPNKGFWVEMFQRYAGGQPGDSWCAAFVSYILGVVCEGFTKAPLPRTMSCDTLLEGARAAGWLDTVPHEGDIFLYLHTPRDAHHTGFVTEILDDGTVVGIAGNTSSDGRSSNGNGVYEHAIVTTPHKIAYINWPR